MTRTENTTENGSEFCLDVNMSIKALRQKECKSQAEFKREITNLAFVKIRHFSPVGKLGFQIQHVEKKRLICV